MKNLPALFDFNGKQLTVITNKGDGELWFVAKEVADILDYSDAFEMTKRLDPDEKSNRQIAGLGSPTGGRGTLVINESGLYSAIIGSSKPEAKPFKKWVTSEVIPSIRKTGSYSLPGRATALDMQREATALKIVTGVADHIFQALPHLSELSKQTLYASLINPLMGRDVIPLPQLTERTWTATEIGETLGISSIAVGRLANTHGLKTDEYCMYVLDKALHSDKQVGHSGS